MKIQDKKHGMNIFFKPHQQDNILINSHKIRNKYLKIEVEDLIGQVGKRKKKNKMKRRKETGMNGRENKNNLYLKMSQHNIHKSVEWAEIRQ